MCWQLLPDVQLTIYLHCVQHFWQPKQSKTATVSLRGSHHVVVDMQSLATGSCSRLHVQPGAVKFAQPTSGFLPTSQVNCRGQMRCRSARAALSSLIANGFDGCCSPQSYAGDSHHQKYRPTNQAAQVNQQAVEHHQLHLLVVCGCGAVMTSSGPATEGCEPVQCSSPQCKAQAHMACIECLRAGKDSAVFCNAACFRLHWDTHRKVSAVEPTTERGQMKPSHATGQASRDAHKSDPSWSSSESTRDARQFPPTPLPPTPPPPPARRVIHPVAAHHEALRSWHDRSYQPGFNMPGRLFYQGHQLAPRPVVVVGSHGHRGQW